MAYQLPTSQGELIRTARGALTQREFAKTLGVDRTSLSRYESEQLGAPTSVLNHCLAVVSAASASAQNIPDRIGRALNHARLAVRELEVIDPKD